ncbi:L domain-like protein [Fragilariopsis cylindrus CCMP1102]|uniref:L domain-like protein n=1 Tax=Fragilariopsis cylindrus CCMP1102 TaxID=635003 RepID=A0A1E7EYF3_9STRA|nr:L domain-like protein [Fragilariopsis cylindrus CCMP1102]|eukprot:OEU11040.1 L domain-like protein [Fragilariopsis cylindrus CCMP1102]
MTLSSTTIATPTTTTTSMSTIVEEEDDEDNANNEWLSSMEITMSIDKGETSAEQNNQVKVGSNDNIMRPTIGSYSNPNSNNNNNNNIHINNDRSSLKVIDFSNNVLTGTIPRTVAFNNNLEVLALQRNAELTGTIPTEIAVLTSLIQLQLSDCDLDGRLPLEFLLVMPKLERLIVAYNRLTGTIPGDIIFTNYRTLNNDNNNDSSNNAILYSPLHGFNIGDNRMTGTLPTTLGLLRNLSYLQLFGNEFNGEIPTNYLLRDRHSSIDVNDNDNGSNNNDYDNIQRLWLHDNPNLSGSMPCPSNTDDTDIASLGQQQQQQQQESSSSLGDGNSEEAQQQESSTIFLDYASDCSSNPSIICPCCNRCF